MTQTSNGQKWHIGKNGYAQCRAKTPAPCPLSGDGKEDNHYDTEEEARKAWEERQAKTYGTGTIRSVGLSPTPAMMPPKRVVPQKPVPPAYRSVNRGKFKKGEVSRTVGQVKKHVSHMSDSEKTKIHSALEGIKDFTYSYHVQEKMAKEGLGFRKEYIAHALRTPEDRNIIEYNQTTLNSGNVSHRIVVRSSETYRTNIEGTPTDCNICFVVDVNLHKIVTVYWNEANDHHHTINPKRYTPELQLGF